MSYEGKLVWNRLRQNVQSASRRLIIEATGAQGKTPIVTVGIVVSGVPRTIPDFVN